MMNNNINQQNDYQSKLDAFYDNEDKNQLEQLRQKYSTVPNYKNMSLRDELQTRFDLKQMNNLEKRVGKNRMELVVQKNYNQHPLMQISGAMYDMSKNYFDMRKDRTVKGDDYFHCKANYEAAARGPMGNKVAEVLGTAKERFDYYYNQWYKGLSSEASYSDCLHDLKINKLGRELAKSGMYDNSIDACDIYRVNGINKKY